MSSTIDRRSLITTAAAAVPAVALAAAPALASPDAELVELGRQAEALVVEHSEAVLGWAPRLCEAHRAVNSKFGHLKEPYGSGPDDPQRHASDKVMSAVLAANGYEDFSDREWDTAYALLEIRDRAEGIDATTPAGLRVKFLLAMWVNAPSIAHRMDEFHWDEDRDLLYELVRSAASVAGLLPLLDHYEKRFAEVAAQIKAAGGDGREEHHGTQRNEYIRTRARQQAQRRKAERRAAIRQRQRTAA